MSAAFTTPAARLAVIDVGNSSTAFGLYERGRIKAQERVPTNKRMPAEIERLVQQWQAGQALTGAAVASVVPAANAALKKALRRRIDEWPLFVDHRLALGAPITYPDPASIGPDRLANLAGAVGRYQAPVIVVDIGTATTFDIIQARKGYTGGVIAPGPALMLDYLAEKTALLPRIDLTPVRAMIGKSTEQAMRLGALHGYRGMVKEIVNQLGRTIRGRPATLCATGGYARWVLKGMELPFIYDKDLTLYGIGRIYELNA